MLSITKVCKKYKLVLFAVSCFLVISCGKNLPEEKILAGRALGTTYQIKYFSENDLNLKSGVDSIFQAINKSMSTYSPDSDISKINKGDSLLVVDDMFVEVFKTSKIIFEKSDGYFDPTVGNLVNFYGFGPDKFTLKIDSANIDSLMQYVGFDKVKLTPNHTIRKSDTAVYIDFNAIAKGFSVDRLAAYLQQNGVENYLVEVGGELVAHGKNLSNHDAWKVGIDDPKQTSGKRTLATVIELKNHGMATSGNYRKFRVDSATGEKYMHTINPLTGYPARNSVLSASVLAKNCMLADGYATTFMALGLEKSKELLKTLPDIDAYLIYAEKDSIGTFMTEGFKRQLVEG
ncbi:MAG TPA: FAD:protein FMN transferase [Flavobacteriaceae bacterium]|nr:FAD:protein FMN transferase [Flavobacteriaceae bacterium]